MRMGMRSLKTNMKTKFVKYFILFSLVVNHCTPSKNVVDISKSWEFKLGYDMRYFSLDSSVNDPKTWETIDLPNNITSYLGLKNYSGYITLRRQIPSEIISNLKETDSLAIDVGRVLDVSRYFINGNYFANMGEVHPYLSAAMRPFLRNIPNQFIKRENPNYIYIVLFTNGDFPLQLMDKIKIGRSDEVFVERNNREIIAFFFLTTYLVYGLYHIILSIRRPQDKYNLYFGLFCITISIYWFTANTVTRDAIFQDKVILQRKLEHVFLFMSTPLFLIFFNQYFRRDYGKFSLVYLGISYIVSVLTLFLSIPFMRICMSLFLLSMLVVVFPYMLYLFYRELKAKNRDANFFFVGIILFSLGSAIDILISRNILHNIPFISNYVFFAIILGIVFLMADKFMRVTNGFEMLSKELEKKVEERTRELHESLIEIKNLKIQQDGDYFLTSLLTKPFSEKMGKWHINQNISLETFITQKKKFEFKNKKHEIGGDLCIYDKIYLHNEEYLVFVNGDAMGKSIQGAGGVLVFGTVFKAILERTKKQEPNLNIFPEVWLHDTYEELQKVFLSFKGSMLVSCIVGLIHIPTGVIYFFNAEHPFMVLYRDKKAQFIEKETTMKKIGTDPIFTEFHLQIFRLKEGDQIFTGSDGKDDLNLNTLESGERKINEDETLFLRVLEEAEGDLNASVAKLSKIGELIDDLSLLKVAYLKHFEEQKNEMILNYLNEYNWEKIEEIAETQTIPKEVFSCLIEHHIIEKNYIKAGYWLDKMITDYPESTQHIYLASFIKKKNRQFKLALEYGKRVYYRQREHLLNLINLADLYHLFGNKELALEITNLALKISPNEPKALRLLEVIQSSIKN